MSRGATAAVLCLFLLGGAWASRAAAQATGTITGKVLDKKTGDPIIEAGVEVVGTGKKTRTDLDGVFNLKVAPGSYEVRIFAPLYEGTRLQHVVVRENELTRADASLGPEGEAGVEVVEVVAQASKAAEATQLLQRKKAAVVSDSVAAQSITKSPDSDAAEVVERVPSVTIKDGFVFVRGLGERYSMGLLNGSRLPSIDPDKRVIALDIFPADFIESLNVIKSSSPDLPGDFSGGLVDINLKEFPEQLQYSIGASLKYNSYSTFQSIDTYDGCNQSTLAIGNCPGLPSTVPKLRPPPAEEPERTTARVRSQSAGFDNVWTPERTTAPPGYDINFSIGNSFGPLGVAFAAIVGGSNEFHPTEIRRTLHNTNMSSTSEDAIIEINDDYTYRHSLFKTKLGGLTTVGYKIDSENKVTLRALVNQRSLDSVLNGSGTNNEDQERRFTDRELQYLEQRLGFGQLAGEHRAGNIEIAWRSALSQTVQDEPDTRISQFTQELASTAAPTVSSAVRYNASLSEYLTDSGADVTTPFTTALPFTDVWSGLPAKFKSGFAYLYRQRNFSLRRFRYNFDDANVDPTQPLEVQLRPQNIGIDKGFIDFEDTTTKSDLFGASQEIAAGYGMFDLPIVPDKLRLIAGVRTEYSYIKVNAFDFNFGTPLRPRINDLNPLPSINLIYSPREDMNIRVGYSQTVSRPEFRELNPSQFPVAGGTRTVVGNPNLISADISGEDLRWEWFLSPTELLSASFFYKDLTNPIEQIAIAGISSRDLDSFINADSATIWGFEFEARKNFGFVADWLDDRGTFASIKPILPQISLLSNVSIIESSVDVPKGKGQTQTSTSRQLQGQAPLLVNAAVEYQPTDDTLFRLLYNTIGNRIVAAGVNGLPDIEEQRRDQLDFVALTKFEVAGVPLNGKFSVENILNDSFLQTEGDVTTLRYREGVTCSVGVSYSF